MSITETPKLKLHWHCTDLRCLHVSFSLKYKGKNLWADLFHKNRLHLSSVFNWNSYSENTLHKVTIDIHYFTLQSIFYTTGSSKNSTLGSWELETQFIYGTALTQTKSADLTPNELKYSHHLNMGRKRKSFLQLPPAHFLNRPFFLGIFSLFFPASPSHISRSLLRSGGECQILQ